MSTKKKYLAFFICVMIAQVVLAQKNERKNATPPPKVKVSPMPQTITFNPFNPEDTLSEHFGYLLNNYFAFGKFQEPFNALTGKSSKDIFMSLFTPQAHIANDLGAPANFTSKIPIKDYATQAAAKRPRNYELFLQKGLVVEGKLDTLQRDYVAEYPIFKLFADKALHRYPYQLGAIYILRIRINAKKHTFLIEDIRIEEGNVFENFALGGFNFQGDSPLLITSSLESLVRDVKEAIDPNDLKRRDSQMALQSYNATEKSKSEDKRRVLTRSNISVTVGLHIPEYMAPIPVPQNTSEDASYTGTQSGDGLGVIYQKVVGKNDGFGWFVGLSYNRMYFNASYENLGIVYNQSPNGEPLQDLEGNKYDYRFVDVHQFKDVGYLNYLTPEFGFLLNIHLGKGAYFQATSSLAHHSLIQNTSNTSGIVSYRGQVDGQGAPISQDELGFYTNKEVEWSRSFTEMQSFMAYHLGLSLNIMLGQKMAFYLEGRYNHSLAYAIRQKVNTDLPFFDIDENSWKSPMNYLPESRHFQSFSIQAGLRYYLFEMR